MGLLLVPEISIHSSCNVVRMKMILPLWSHFGPVPAVA
jgi:hypothetical protein